MNAFVDVEADTRERRQKASAVLISFLSWTRLRERRRLRGYWH